MVASVAGLVRFFWFHWPKIYKKLRHNMFGIGDIKTDLACVAKQLDFIVTELHPNGGTSIRDSLNRIEVRQVLHDQRQRALMSDMAIGVFETDEEGLCVWANRKYLRMTGRTFLEVSGSGWTNILAPEDRDRVVKAWADAIDEEREFEDEYYIVTPEGVRTRVRAQSYKMHTSDGAPIGYLGMLTPLNEQGHKATN